jgi:hypothetical protein
MLKTFGNVTRDDRRSSIRVKKCLYIEKGGRTFYCKDMGVDGRRPERILKR